MHGKLITFEGVDGSGKSLQIERLEQELAQRGYDVLRTKEPGSPHTPLGQPIRDVLFHNPSTREMVRGVPDLLFLADHLQHVERVVRPALMLGKIVLCDRYADSQFAYSVVKKPPASIDTLFRSLYGPVPDLTLLFTGDPEVFAARARKRDAAKNALEPGKQDGKKWADARQQQLVQDAYLRTLGNLARTRIIDAERPIEAIADEVWMHVLDVIDVRVEAKAA